ncbi:MAG: ABC transporter permease [Salinibacter sp.]
MRALTTKMWRTLWDLRGPILGITLVIVSAVATFVSLYGTMDALTRSRDAFYKHARFADAFASLKRAPLRVADRLRRIPGVDAVQARIRAEARLDVPGVDDTVTGSLFSYPETGRPRLNQLVLDRGRRPRPGRRTEVVTTVQFAGTHDLKIGDTVTATVEGQRRTLTIVGVAYSPEFVYQIEPGSFFPDAKRYGVFWMPRSALAEIRSMEGAFNDVALGLTATATPQDVLDRVNQVLRPYGGQSAYLREDQASNQYLASDLGFLRQFSVALPLIILVVAAVLLNVILARLVRTQRAEIATLKAFGYGDGAIGGHYLSLVLVIVAGGTLVGMGLGVWLAQELAQLYLEFYHFPELKYVLHPSTLLLGSGVTALAAVLGALYAVWRAVRLDPAVAMRPPTPRSYRETLVERLGLKDWFSQETRMILRHLERQPLRAALTVFGVTVSISTVMVGFFMSDAMDRMLAIQFDLAQRQDATVTFTAPTGRNALYELMSVRGVRYAEPFRSVPVRLRHEHRERRVGIEGLSASPRLRRPINVDLKPIDVPPAGLVLTDYLAETLRVQPGDSLRVQVLGGARPERVVPVAGLTTQYVGTGAYMRLAALNDLLRRGPALSGAYIALDEHRQEAVLRALNERPRIAGIQRRGAAIAALERTMTEAILTFAVVLGLFATAIAFGVIYNSGRITLSERVRELASLRVLGFTRGEIGYILLGELGLLTLLAIPIGLLAGWGLCAGLVRLVETDLFRMPMVLTRSTLAWAATVVLGVAGVTGLLLWRRVRDLDFTEALDARE